MHGPLGTILLRFGRSKGRCRVLIAISRGVILAWGCGYWSIKETMPRELARIDDMESAGGAVRYWAKYVYHLPLAVVRAGSLFGGRWKRYHPMEASVCMRSKNYVDQVSDWMSNRGAIG